MYKVILQDKTNYDYWYHNFDLFSSALDFAIEHYKEFVRLDDKNGDTIYNNVDHNGIGGFTFSYYCERLG